MITRVVIRNLKRFQEQSFSGLGDLHLLVGQNNSGKSTLLQALAIWNYCVEEFRASARTGNKAIEITLSNFTPLPLSDFRLLWHEKTERTYPETGELDPVTGRTRRRQEFIYIELEVAWRRPGSSEDDRFTVLLRWHNRSTVYVSPKGGWAEFRALDAGGNLDQTRFPRMVYVPPSTNIEAMETPVDDANLRARVGEGRPGSVVRNLIWKTFQAERKGQAPKRYSQPFSLLRDQIEEWFGVTVNDPEYIEGRSRYVVSTYTVRQKVELDWVNAGSGLLQSLIILSFLYGFQPDVLLLDEPDAHLHVNLQRAMLDFLNRQTQTQMLIATHAEEFIKRVRPEQISFLTTDGVRRVPDTEQARLVLSEISNLDLLNLLARKLIIYVEGETDEECIRGWARAMVSAPGFEGLPQAMESATFIPLGGGNAEEMLDRARRHFRACRFLDPSACRLMVMDRNDGKWQPRLGRDSTLVVWSRRHVESYLLVPAAWERAATSAAERQFTLARDRALAETQGFFREQSGGLDIDWMNPAVEAFRDPNAKLMLFEARVSRGDTYNALAARLYDAGVRIQRRDVAMAMPPDEIHADVKAVLTRIVAETARKPGLEIRETADDDWDISGGALPQRQRPVPDAHDG